MLKRAWSTRLDGDSHYSTIIDRGLVIVSTTRREDGDAPAGVSATTVVEATASSSWAKTRYSNAFAHRCHAIAAGGAIAWRAEGVVAKGARPNGDVLATNDRHDLVVLRAGATVETRALGGEPWHVIGCHGARPVLSPILGAAWVEPSVYAVVDGRLQRSDADGTVLERIPLARQPFEAVVRDQGLSGWLPSMQFPDHLDLAYHPKLDRFIASHWAVLAWTLCLRRDGAIDWLRLLSDRCCNHVRFVGDGVAHLSSCGEALTFLALDGTVGRVHRLPELTGKIVEHGGTVVVEAAGVLHTFDEHGEPRWTLQVPDLDGMCFDAGVLYTVSGRRGALELSAWM